MSALVFASSNNSCIFSETLVLQTTTARYSLSNIVNLGKEGVGVLRTTRVLLHILHLVGLVTCPTSAVRVVTLSIALLLLVVALLLLLVGLRLRLRVALTTLRLGSCVREASCVSSERYLDQCIVRTVVLVSWSAACLLRRVGVITAKRKRE